MDALFGRDSRACSSKRRASYGTTLVAHRSTHHTALHPARPRPAPHALSQERGSPHDSACASQHVGTEMDAMGRYWLSVFSLYPPQPGFNMECTAPPATMHTFNEQRSSPLSSPTGESEERRAAAAQQALRLACACTARGRGGELPAAATKVWSVSSRLLHHQFPAHVPKRISRPCLCLASAKASLSLLQPNMFAVRPRPPRRTQPEQAFSSSTPCSAPTGTGCAAVGRQSGLVAGNVLAADVAPVHT